MHRKHVGAAIRASVVYRANILSNACQISSTFKRGFILTRRVIKEGELRGRPSTRRDDSGGERDAHRQSRDPTLLLLLRDERLGRVLARLRPLAHRRLTVGVSSVVRGVDGRGDVTLTVTLFATDAILGGSGLAAQILDQHAVDRAVVEHALVAVAQIDDAKILAADIDAGVRALPTLGDTGGLVTRIGRA